MSRVSLSFGVFITLQVQQNSAKSWWKIIKFDQKVSVATLIATIIGVIISVIGLFVAFASIMSSPEEDLFKLGYRKSPEELWKAVWDRNVKAVALFGKAKVMLPASYFVPLFEDTHFDPEIVDALIEGKSVRDSDCPTKIEEVKFYQVAAADAAKAKRLREICGKPIVISGIMAARKLEAGVIAANSSKNDGRPRRISECRSRYIADENLFKDSAKFNSFSVNTYSERQCILAAVQVHFLTGDPGIVTNGTVLRHHIEECCEKYDPIQNTSVARLQQADQAVEMLSGQ